MADPWTARWRDYYEILQVHPKAGQPVIAKAYRTLAMIHHSDHGGSDAAMAQLNEAYEVLSDPARRGRYDVAYAQRQTGWVERITRHDHLDPHAAIAECLKATGLKFVRLGGGFVLPFRTKEVGETAAQVRVVEDLAVIAAPLAQVKTSDAEAMHHLLRATYTLDTYKLCCDRDGDLLIAAEIPHSLVTATLLERFIRGCIDLVDARGESYRSAEGVERIVRAVQSRTALGLLMALARDQADDRPAAGLLPRICRSNGIECRPTGESRFSLRCSTLPFHIHAVCGMADVSLIVPTGMKPRGGEADFYAALGRINMKMNVCKVALDSDDEVAFLYELPRLDEESFLQAMRRLEGYLLGVGVELVAALERARKSRGGLGRLRFWEK